MADNETVEKTPEQIAEEYDEGIAKLLARHAFKQGLSPEDVQAMMGYYFEGGE